MLHPYAVSAYAARITRALGHPFTNMAQGGPLLARQYRGNSYH